MFRELPILENSKEEAKGILKREDFIKRSHCRLFHYECLLNTFPFSYDTILKRTCVLHRELMFFSNGKKKDIRRFRVAIFIQSHNLRGEMPFV